MNRPLKRLTVGVGLAAASLLLFTGCMAGSSQSSVGPGDASGGDALPSEPSYGGEQALGTDAGSSADGSEPMAPDAASDAAARDTDRSIVSTGSLSIRSDDPIAAAARATTIVSTAGGRVDSRSEFPEADDQEASAYLVVRIPTDRLDDTIDELRSIGDVTSVSMDESDVTRTRTDIDARIDALRASVDRLRELIEQATTTADLIAAESELTDRQGELDSLVAQRDILVDQVELATVSIDLMTEAPGGGAGPDDFFGGLLAGWNALIGFAAGAVVALGVVLPWLLAIGLLVAIVAVIVRLSRRRSRR